MPNDRTNEQNQNRATGQPGQMGDESRRNQQAQENTGQRRGPDENKASNQPGKAGQQSGGTQTGQQRQDEASRTQQGEKSNQATQQGGRDQDNRGNR